MNIDDLEKILNLINKNLESASSSQAIELNKIKNLVTTIKKKNMILRKTILIIVS